MGEKKKSERPRYRDARFCPYCGAESLDRDRYGETLTKPRYKNEFSCRACGVGIQISPSLRTQTANALAKSHRELRPPQDPKPRPADEQLAALNGLASRLPGPISVRRSKNRPSYFVIEITGRKAHGSTDFSRAMIFLEGMKQMTEVL